MSHTALNWHTPDKHDAILWYYYNTPAGKLILCIQGKILCNMHWLTPSSNEQTPSPATAELQKQLRYYWLTSKADITLPLLRQGTSFQQSVWSTLRQIPMGQTRTYGELAKQLNTSPRALANACRKNPFPLIIPCHRVLAKTGIGGYAGKITGKLIEIKTALLQHEKMIIHEL